MHSIPKLMGQESGTNRKVRSTECQHKIFGEISAAYLKAVEKKKEAHERRVGDNT